jgi:hypothetical protein
VHYMKKNPSTFISFSLFHFEVYINDLQICTLYFQKIPRRAAIHACLE